MKIPPWSFSSLSTFSSCPKKYYHLKVAKDVQDSTGEAALWGGMVHVAIENRLKDKTPLPEEFAMYADYCDKIEAIAGEMHVELELAIDKSFKPVGFGSDEAWCRGIIDVLHLQGDRALVLDHKTGKRKPDTGQLKLFALMVFYHYPQIMSVKTGFFWLKTFEKDTAEFTRDQMPHMWRTFLSDLTDYKTAFKTDRWEMRTSGLCKQWCPVVQCQHNGKRKR